MDNYSEYYSRHFPLSSIGEKNQRKLGEKTVLVAGVGGLGTVSSDLLASLGIGHIKLVDYDVVDLSNLPRQKLYTTEDVGKPKVEIAATRLRKRNPFITVETFPLMINRVTANSLLEGVDLVIDGLDRFQTRKNLHEVAFRKKIPYVFAGAVGESANMMSFDYSTYDPQGPCLECVIGEIKDNDNMRCEVLGVNPLILHLIVGYQVSEACNILLGRKPILEQKMRILELDTLQTIDIKTPKREDCRVCSREKFDEIEEKEINLGNLGKAQLSTMASCRSVIIDIGKPWIESEFASIKDYVREEFQIQSEGDNFISFIHKDKTISLMLTGILIFRDADMVEEALEFAELIFEKIL